MKESGIPWIGMIPDNWEVKRLKEVFVECKEKSLDGAGELLSLSQYTGVQQKKDTDKAGTHESETYEGYNVVHKGQLVMNIMLAWNGSYAISDYDGIISPAYCVFDFRIDCAKQYFHYLLRTNGYPSAFKTLSRGIIDSRLRLYPEQFYTFPTIFPPLPTQQRIADFLDRKCAEIDKLAALQETMIAELKRYKQSVITEAVTKGLDPDVPMKDSGVEWIGEIPERWEVTRFYKVNNIRGRLGWKGLKAEEYQESGYPFLSAFNINNDKLDWSDLNFINKDRYDESPEIKLSVGDVLIVKDGAGIGKCARISELPYGESTVNSSIAVITPPSFLDYGYLYYYILSNPFQRVIWFLKIGMGVPLLTQENMRNIKMPFPPLAEQRTIADYLDRKCAEIDELIAIKQQKIEALKEYKKSVIFEYVTGKKEIL